MKRGNCTISIAYSDFLVGCRKIATRIRACINGFSSQFLDNQPENRCNKLCRRKIYIAGTVTICQNNRAVTEIKFLAIVFSSSPQGKRTSRIPNGRLRLRLNSTLPIHVFYMQSQIMGGGGSRPSYKNCQKLWGGWSPQSPPPILLNYTCREQPVHDHVEVTWCP